LLENENDFNYGTYSKEEVIAKVGPGGQVRWGSKLVTVDELPDQVQFTKVISGIPTFLPVGKPKDMGDSSKTIAYQAGLEQDPTLDEMEGDKNNKSLTSSLLGQYKGKTGPQGLIISKLLTLEKVLTQLKKEQSSNPDSNVTVESIVDMVLKTFNEIREI
jgi:hypothetical protein